MPQRVAEALARIGGAVLLATATLTTASVLLRWATAQPIPGDFELAALGAGLAVMGMLAWGTARRANILVDSATSWLPARVVTGIDTFWTAVWAVVAALLATRLVQGAIETRASGTTTMALDLPTWWAVGLGAVGFAATAAVAVTVARDIWRERG